MKAFGIELRRANSIVNLYEDVDKTLANAGLQPGQPINANIQIQSVAHSLQRMFDPEKYCDVCCIRECAQLCGIYIDSKRMQVYSTQHCVRWNQMIPEFRQTIMAMILDDFRSVLNYSA